MSRITTYICTLSLVFLLSGFTLQDNPELVDEFFNADTSVVGDFDFSEFTILDLDESFNRASAMVNNTANSKQSGLGHLYLAILSDYIKKQIEAGEISPKKRKVRQLLKKFESEQYFIHQPKIPNFLKLMHNACEGNFKYIYSRFKVSGLFIPVLLVLFLFVVFVVLNVLKKIPWKYTRLTNKIILIGFGLFIVLAIIFKFTCNDFVQTDSFYGIPF